MIEEFEFFTDVISFAVRHRSCIMWFIGPGIAGLPEPPRNCIKGFGIP